MFDSCEPKIVRFQHQATVKEPKQINIINIDKDRVQFSGMLGPGLQFDISKDFGIYVEPTARYYFNYSVVRNNDCPSDKES